MNADQAFDNLMHKNAIAVPVAAPEEASPPPPHRIPEPPPETGSVRVSELLDDEPADYVPRRGTTSVDSERFVYGGHPTEADLEPVTEYGGDLANANMHGARIVGRDTGAYAAGDNEGWTEHDGGDDAHDAAPESDGDPRLSGARRLRRFAYLPLANMDGFEAQARETAARLTAMTPDAPSLLVTSAARGEGRTELAIRLALALGRRVGYRVLLADFDTGNPQIAPRLGVSSKYFTLVDVLRGGCPLGDALAHSDEDNLFVLPTRASDRAGDELLDSRQAENLFQEIHRTFDFAILDCGPIGRPEAAILGRLAGAVALAGLCGVSSASAMREAGDRLAAGGARVAGMILAGG